LLSEEQLIAEGRINPQTSSSDEIDVSMPSKRRRMSTCYRTGYAGKRRIVIPYRCWKGKCSHSVAQKWHNFCTP